MLVITIVHFENLTNEGMDRNGERTSRTLTLRISFIMSAGSIELVVFIDHVKRSERGLISPMPPPDAASSVVIAAAAARSSDAMFVLFRSAGRRYDDDDDGAALAVLPPMADILLVVIAPPVAVDDVLDSRMDFLDSNDDKKKNKVNKNKIRAQKKERWIWVCWLFLSLSEWMTKCTGS